MSEVNNSQCGWSNRLFTFLNLTQRQIQVVVFDSIHIIYIEIRTGHSFVNTYKNQVFRVVLSWYQRFMNLKPLSNHFGKIQFFFFAKLCKIQVFRSKQFTHCTARKKKGSVTAYVWLRNSQLFPQNSLNKYNKQIASTACNKEK